VLFLGNSYTYVNDLPSTFAKLSQSSGRPVQTDMVANGAETLAQHAASPDDASKIASQGWSYVVLQEQSDTPAYSRADWYIYPSAQTLVVKAKAVGATSMLFMTWAHKAGEPSAGLPGYESTQQRIDGTYVALSGELHVPVAPVGYTWYHVRQDHPDINLWQDDGSHPTTAGTYLAACVFYAAIFGQSPDGITFHDGLPDDQARILQDEASHGVLDMQTEWGLR
jgi:hypothetical protein